MVCKENVVSWFRDLSSYERLDVLCTLLNMCLPFEVRYLGTCVEDRGKRDYNELRESEHHANSASDLAELTTLGVSDKRTRRKLALYMALLHSCNYACAVVHHKILSSLESQEISGILNGGGLSPDDQPLEELLLIYTMALNHPAFTYEQKATFGNIFMKLQEEEASRCLSKPANAVNSSYKSAQGCGPCTTPTDRSVSTDSGVEMPANCSVPPPQIQPYHGEMRNNAMVSGVPPGLTLPPPGLCLPGPDQMPMGSTTGAQYLHLSYPGVNHMTPWTGPVMMGNQVMYHTGDMLAYPPSPLVSRQSSPSQSRSPSRSNSPLARRNNPMPRTSAQVIQSTSNTLTTSVSASNSQPNISSTNVTTHHPPPSLGCASRSLPGGPSPLLPPRSSHPSTTSTSSSYSRHNSVDNTSTSSAPMTSQKQPPPPPPHLQKQPPVIRGNLGTAISTSQKQPPPPPHLQKQQPPSLLAIDTHGTSMSNLKGNLQNFSMNEIRRMSDEDLREIGLTPNAVGQLRSIDRSQTTNGLGQLGMDKKLDGTNNATHPVVDQSDNEETQQQQQQQQQQPQQPLQQSMHHPHNHSNAPNMRRYPTIPPLEPTTMQMYQPPPLFAAQNPPCYSCISMSVASMPTRYSRSNAQQVYCLGQLQALRLDPESSRHCSQSSSSESTGSRSPPETPPAAPWVNNNAAENTNAAPPTTDHQSSVTSHHSSSSASHQTSQPMQQIPERPRNHSKKNHSHGMRQKNSMVNGVSGGGNGSSSGGGNCGGPPNIQHCVSFAGPPTPSPVAFIPHAHFPALRPNTGLYSNFSHAAYARPTYQATYQPNGEMMYQQYPGQPGPGGTPPPPAAAAPPQSYMPSTPVVTYTPVQPTKISCYNCGSCSHLAVDCKDQTMEDLTKRAPYRLDYTIMKQPGECPSSDK